MNVCVYVCVSQKLADPFTLLDKTIPFRNRLSYNSNVPSSFLTTEIFVSSFLPQNMTY